MVETKIKLKPMLTLFKAHQSLVKFIKDDIKNTSFDLNEFSVFEIIFHYENITVQKINEKLLIAPSSLSYILDKLEKRNLIKRKVSSADKRSYIISLTKEGNKLANNIFPIHYDHLKEIFSILSDEDKTNLVTILKKLGYHIESIL